MKGYKFLTSEMKSKNGNETPWEMGVWKEWGGELEMCNKGFHACKEPMDSLNYIYGDRWFEVEADGKIIEGNDKFVCSKMRILRELSLKEIMVKFAIACAKNCLFRFEQKYLDDDRPRKAIEAAENSNVDDANYAIHAANAATYAAAAAAAAAAYAIHAAAYAIHAANATTYAYAIHAAAAAAYAYAVRAAAAAAYAIHDDNAATYAAAAADAYIVRAAVARDAANVAADDDAYTVHAAADAAYTATNVAEKKWQNKKLKQILNSYVDY